jgi:hypothetical protein
MIDDASQSGGVPCWVPAGAPYGSAHGNGTRSIEVAERAASPATRGHELEVLDKRVKLGKLPYSCDASWASAYPSVAYALFKWNGDVTAPRKYWAGLTRFIDLEYAQTANGTSISDISSTWGDWQPAPGTMSHPSFSPEGRVDKKFVGIFSFLKDVGHMLEMSAAIEGEPGRASAAKYAAMYAQVKTAFHAQWYDAANGWYADGGQTAQVLALQLDRRAPLMMSAAEKAAVLSRLVHNVVALHGNRSTSGIQGFRYVCDVLSENGRGDVAFALLTQTEYPSFGYQILQPYEPATTLWELWDSDEQYSSLHPMNSRNHVMFAGPGGWLHTYVGGIANAPGSIGYEHVWFAPPATLIEAAQAQVQTAGTTDTAGTGASGIASGSSTSWGGARDRSGLAASAADPLRWVSATRPTGRGTFGLFWSLAAASATNQSCGFGAEGNRVVVNCTGVGISEVSFADYGTPAGDCGSGLRKGACTTVTANLTALASAVCRGADSCALECSDRVASSQFMGCNITASSAGSGSGRTVGVALPDPCNGVRKAAALQARCNGAALSIRATAPGNSIATTAVPLLGVDAQDVTVTEGGTVLWANGQFLPGVDGISAALELDGAILVSHGSGVYDFRRTSS